MKLYLDGAYIAKCYLREPGTDAVLDLVESSTSRFSSILALIEVSAVFHRHLREGKISPRNFRKATDLFKADQEEELWTWISLTDDLVHHAASEYSHLSSKIFLRSADCLHLVSARRAGFSEVYSNDRHLLNAASHFGLKGKKLSRKEVASRHSKRVIPKQLPPAPRRCHQARCGGLFPRIVRHRHSH